MYYQEFTKSKLFRDFDDVLKDPIRCCYINLKTAGMVLGYLYDAPEFNLNLSNINDGHHPG